MTRMHSDGARASPSPSFRWDAKLTRPLQVRDGPKLETLTDAGRLIAKLPWRYQRHQAWVSATELLMAAAERGGSIESTTDQIEGALFLTYMLALAPAATKPRPLGIYAERPLLTNCRVLRFRSSLGDVTKQEARIFHVAERSKYSEAVHAAPPERAHHQGLSFSARS
jgi:hypothetical protein